MERESFKEYSEAAMVKKEELHAIKSCFEELYTFLSMRGDISWEVRTEQAECFQAAEVLNRKRNHIFRWEFMLITICD